MVVNIDHNKCDEAISFVVNAVISHVREVNILKILKRNKPLPEPIKAYIGDVDVKYLLHDVSVKPPTAQLNQYQVQLADLNNLQSCMQFMGPPGTGKSHTISIFMEQLMLYTDYDVVLLSEKNTAVTAVMENLMQCIQPSNKSKFNSKLWSSIITFCSTQASPLVKQFSEAIEKYKLHPTYKTLHEAIDKATKSLNKTHKQIKETIEMLDGLDIYLMIQSTLDEFYQLDAAQQKEWWYGDPTSSSNPHKHQRLIHSKLMHLRQQKSNTQDESVHKDSQYHPDMFPDIQEIFQATFEALQLLKKPHQKAMEMSATLKQLKVEKKELSQHYKELFCRNSRVFMSTFGSFSRVLEWFKHDLHKQQSHKQQSSTESSSDDDVDDVDDVDDDVDATNINDATVTNTRGTTKQRKVVVMIDEASTVPHYDIHTLTLLENIPNIEIKSLILVGDDKQLQPFNPLTKTTQNVTFDLPSLLDNDFMSLKTKYYFEQQYRVPRAIAEVLNRHIYDGRYRTDESIEFLDCPIYLHNVWSTNQKKPPNYFNYDEINKVVELYRRFQTKNVLVITPYTEQMKRLIDAFKDNNFDHNIISTIDKCQGLEADIVIFSMVLPYITRHLSNLSNGRLCVALSRQRQQLHIVGDEYALSRFTKCKPTYRNNRPQYCRGMPECPICNADDCCKLVHDILELAQKQ